jgi:hypothetical protein
MNWEKIGESWDRMARGLQGGLSDLPGSSDLPDLPEPPPPGDPVEIPPGDMPQPPPMPNPMPGK